MPRAELIAETAQPAPLTGDLECSLPRYATALSGSRLVRTVAERQAGYAAFLQLQSACHSPPRADGAACLPA
jgi:hypothetical protein